MDAGTQWVLTWDACQTGQKGKWKGNVVAKQSNKHGVVGSWHGTGQADGRRVGAREQQQQQAAAEHEASSAALRHLPGPGRITLERGRPGGVGVGVGVVELGEKVVVNFAGDNHLFLSASDVGHVVVVVVVDGAAAILHETNTSTFLLLSVLLRVLLLLLLLLVVVVVVLLVLLLLLLLLVVLLVVVVFGCARGVDVVGRLGCHRRGLRGGGRRRRRDAAPERPTVEIPVRIVAQQRCHEVGRVWIGASGRTSPCVP
jgi:hypothetical protein